MRMFQPLARGSAWTETTQPSRVPTSRQSRWSSAGGGVGPVEGVTGGGRGGDARKKEVV